MGSCHYVFYQGEEWSAVGRLRMMKKHSRENFISQMRELKVVALSFTILS